MEETHNPCPCIQAARASNETLKYCLTEQHAICSKCYTHCVGLTHLCVSLPLNYKQYSILRPSHCFLTKGSTFLKIKTDASVRLAIERFAAVSGTPEQSMQLVDPSGNLFDSNTLQAGYVYLLNETRGNGAVTTNNTEETLGEEYDLLDETRQSMCCAVAYINLYRF
eukprot:TRINITY_DN15526_c0_g2_i3.p1 TRINITY_DN15526_c0_g2~~TRINITY_DN15526_c0_g2_i3.p1  ORF type:complete len:167 (+),score=27.15 TRINITY_DN15526_c0_g2_i3:155-655(+)